MSETVVSNMPTDPDAWVKAQLRDISLKRLRHGVSVWALRVLVIGGALALWQSLVAVGWLDPFVVSSPQAVGTFLLENLGTGKFWADVQVTVLATLIGFIVASIAGVAAAFVLAQSKHLHDVVDPILTFFNSMPRVAFAPLFVVWFGLGITSKIVLAFSLCFFIVLSGALVGLTQVDSDLNTITRQLGANRRQHFLKLVLPNALPSIAASLRLALIYGFLAVVVGEMIGSSSGLGQQIAFYSGVLRMDAVFGILLVLGILVSAAVALLRMVENYFLRWQ
ncbi:ABC transporter permease [Paenarthrobacter ureafaciens]|uniref:ABC transporter permease n=1 Tax=Paenarthrobacter ureafaciens TaxID=37931 RepID=UPI0015BA54F1|nr:ABC transporter permease [Paenarthrobacter ureafaciens]NWL26325.1 ABC transporter permease [Paenarthrobacter ureafaciens]